MLPGPDLVIACSHCGILARQHTLRSGNTFGAILWSDGKMEAPMLPHFPAVTKCYICQHFYWVEEAEVKRKIDYFSDEIDEIQDVPDVPKEWQQIKPIKRLSIDDYIEALELGIGNNIQKERYLRIHLWWATNDMIRRNPEAEVPTKYNEKLQDNFAKLLILLDEHVSDDRMMKAEILRETGHFEETIQLLGNIPEKYRQIADKIIEFAKNRDRVVRQVQRL